MNSVDGQDAQQNIEKRFPFLEYDDKSVDEIAKLSSPRLLKSHMPYGCLPSAIQAGRGKVGLGLQYY